MKWIQAALLFGVAVTLVTSQCDSMPTNTSTVSVKDSLNLPLGYPPCKTITIIKSIKVSSPDGSKFGLALHSGGLTEIGGGGENSCFEYPAPLDQYTRIKVTCQNKLFSCPIEYFIDHSPCDDPVPVQDRDCQYEYVRASGEKCVGDGDDGTCASNGEGIIAETLTISAQPTGNGMACPNERRRTAKCHMKICNDAWTGKYDVSGNCPTSVCCCLSGTVILKQLEEDVAIKADFTGVCPDIDSPVIGKLPLDKEITLKGGGNISLVGSQLVVKNDVQKCSQTATLVTKSVSLDEFKDGDPDVYQSRHSSKLGLYIGVGVGGFALVVVVAVSTVFIVRKRRAAARSDLTDQLLQEGTVDIAYVET